MMTPKAPKQGVMSLAIRDKTMLLAAYMPYLKNGGIFIPTDRSFELGDEVFLLLTAGRAWRPAAGYWYPIRRHRRRPGAEKNRNLSGRCAAFGTPDPYHVNPDRLPAVTPLCQPGLSIKPCWSMLTVT
jgi:hypothetical protein